DAAPPVPDEHIGRCDVELGQQRAQMRSHPLWRGRLRGRLRLSEPGTIVGNQGRDVGEAAKDRAPVPDGGIGVALEDHGGLPRLALLEARGEYMDSASLDLDDLARAAEQPLRSGRI